MEKFLIYTLRVMFGIIFAGMFMTVFAGPPIYRHLQKGEQKKTEIVAEIQRPRWEDWCRRPSVASYWRNPFPKEDEGVMLFKTYAALTSGCFDGREWTHLEARDFLRKSIGL